LANKQEKFKEKIETESSKKIRAKEEGDEILFGLGAFGIIGWSIAVPTLALTFLGLYFDRISTTEISWTITMMVLGLGIGCLNAWYWIKEKSNKK
jgi:ATP synthase protein I